jgi:hypothetical protein
LRPQARAAEATRSDAYRLSRGLHPEKKGDVMGWLKRLRGGDAPSAPSSTVGAATSPGGLQYFEVPVEGSFFLCSDKECPCPGTAHLALGDTGYLCVNPEVIEMRKDALTSAQLERKVAAMRRRVDAMAGGSSTLVFDTGTVYPIIMCKQGAERRGLDLRVAAADAKQWASTGLVPLRETPRRGSDVKVAPASQQLDRRSAALVRDILAHPSPVVFGTVNKDVQQYLDQLQRGGEAAVQPILISVTDCAKGRSGGEYWWKGAQELCSLLARIGSAEAKAALLQILETDSRIVEFGYVRATAAQALADFGDRQLLPRLQRCLEMPNAPVSAINQTITALGGDASSLPKVILAGGRNLRNPREAARYYRRYQPQVAGWPSQEDQGGFYYSFATRVERLRGTEAARPLFAANLVASPGADSAAWLIFPSVPKTSEDAHALAEKYPITPDYLDSVDAADERPAKQPASLAEKGQSENWQLRCSYAEDSQAAPEKLEELIRNDPVAEVRKAACSNPNTPARVLEEFGRLGSTPIAEIVASMSRRGPEKGLWETVAANPNTPLPVLERLASLEISEGTLQQVTTRDRENAEYFVERILWGAAENPSTPATYLERYSKDPNYRIRIRAARNRSMPSQALQMLARDPEPEIRKAAEENPSFRPA